MKSGLFYLQLLDRTPAVPLRKSTSSRQHNGGEAPPSSGGCWPRVRKSELGRQIAVDLKSDANLYENRGRPSHGASFQPHSDWRFPARLPQGKTPQEPGHYIGLIWHSCKGSSASRWQRASVMRRYKARFGVRSWESVLLPRKADIRVTPADVRFRRECVAKLFLHPKQAILIQG